MLNIIIKNIFYANLKENIEEDFYTPYKFLSNVQAVCKINHSKINN